MKKILLLIFIALSINNLFSLEIRTSKIQTGFNKQVFSTFSVIDLFYTNEEELILQSIYFENFRYFCINKNNEIKEIDEQSYNIYKKKQLEYNPELKYGYKLAISDELIAFEKSSIETMTRNYEPDPLFFYIKDKNNQIIFNFNQWKIDHKEYYPEFYFNSLSEKIYYTEEDRIRIMKLNAIYTVENKYYVNPKKNKIAIIMDNYNSEGIRALIIFDVLYNATVNDFRVRLRSEPNLSCETLSYYYTGDKVKIIEQTDEPYEIDGESHYWYKVESGTYPVGWVYGKYLDIENE